jgi:hypothetical protein
MAIERALAISVVSGIMATLCMGCSPVVDACRDNTLLVSVALHGATENADTLLVAVTLDSGATHHATLTHTPGQPVGNVLVQFPSGYPRGHQVMVALTAVQKSVVVGSGGASIALSDACEALALTVSPSPPPQDLAIGDIALPPQDVAQLQDLATPTPRDLATHDLAQPHDLTTGPDLRSSCVPTGAENCFNGIDDDCNGKIDCADPNCAPVAVCVPVTTSPFAYITEEGFGGSCPSGATSGGTLYTKDPSGGGCNNGCGCSASGCSATVQRDEPNCPSGSGSGGSLGTIDGTCRNTFSGMNNLFINTPTGTISCASTGSASPVTPPILTKALQCNVAMVGAGCGDALHVCAPRGSQQCVAAAGAQTCPGSYSHGATWYSSFVDNRSCTCSCAQTSCANAGAVWFNSPSCSGSGVSQSNDICSNDYQYAKIGGGGCTPQASLGATTITFNGQSTVCCE